MSRLYYTPPSDECFEELKQKALEIWGQYDDEYGYRTEKFSRIKDIKNVRDNFMYMVAMFDIKNQAKLAYMLSDETREQVKIRMIDGGQPPEFNVFF